MASKTLAQQMEDTKKKIVAARVTAEQSIKYSVQALEKETGLEVLEIGINDDGSDVFITFYGDSNEFDTPLDEDEEE